VGRVRFTNNLRRCKMDGISIVSMGYEFECPKCGMWNTIGEAPDEGTVVQCQFDKCGAEYRVDEIVHVYE